MSEIFFTTEEEFNIFLGETEHYRSLQDKVIRLLAPDPGRLILELGSGVGATAIALAKCYRDSHIIGVENRREVIKIAEERRRGEGLKNLEFVELDMERIADFLREKELRPDAAVFVYSFHHIQDPIERKKQLARDLFSLMNSGGKVIVGEGIVPVPGGHKEYYSRVLEQERERPERVYLTIFWEEYLRALEGGMSHKKALEVARVMAKRAKKLERLAGIKLAKREGEYPLTLSELEEVWKDAGFKILVSERVNTIGEAIVTGIKP